MLTFKKYDNHYGNPNDRTNTELISRMEE